MPSIFSLSDYTRNSLGEFWGLSSKSYEQVNNDKIVFQGFLKVMDSNRNFKKRNFLLTKSKIYYMQKTNKNAKFENLVLWEKVEPFTEESGEGKIYGFRISQEKVFEDFYVESAEELELWIDALSKVAIMTDLDEDFAIIKEIGQGSYAKVYLAEDLIDHRKFAVKIFSKAQILEFPRKIISLITEIEVMREISHPHLVALHKVYESSSKISLVMDYIPSGDFLKRLNNNKHFPEALAAKFMINLLEALQYLHENSIIHRDLKPENILMTSKDNDFDFKICDFGLSCISKNKQVLRCGSPGYIAPEILNRQPYTNKVDIFSAGVILFILLSGNSPFRGKDACDVLINNKLCKIKVYKETWKNVSGLGIDFVRKLMNPDPNCRFTAEEALRHPWIFKYGKENYWTFATPTTIDVGFNQ